MTGQWQIVLDFIRAYVKKYGVSPSYEVMAKGVGLKSKANMHRIVRRLAKEGHLQIRPNKFYGLKLIDKSVEDVVNL